MNYYNEWDKPTAAWLAQLAADGHVPPGHVDTRSIAEVKGDDLDGFNQCHFFAGIGGWPLALQLAGWPHDRPVWTGSCPCQPFSAAGSRKGASDERHLWPEMFRLIRECRPATVFGEQVASAVAHGWLDGVFTDLEAAGYSCGAVVLGAHSVGAPHIRQRLFWVADTGIQSSQRRTRGFLAAQAGIGRQNGPEHGNQPERLADGCEGGGVGNTSNAGPQGHGRSVDQRNSQGRHATGRHASAAGVLDGTWSNSISIPCGDGKARRIEPGLTPLAHGVPARVVRIRGYGNAIVPQVAAEFVKAYMEVRGG